LKKIRILNITFDTEIKSYEIPAFRGAIFKKAGLENILFHNHLSDNKFLFKYPLIQYKQFNNRPSIVCIEQGVDEIHKYFENKVWDIEYSGKIHQMKIYKLLMNQFTMQVWDKKFEYNIFNWIALNQENIKCYNNLISLTSKISLLENILKANILSFAKGIEWTVEKPIEINIKSINGTRKAKIKGIYMLGFNITFSTNVFIPNNIGLGKSVSLGYGIVNAIKN